MVCPFEWDPPHEHCWVELDVNCAHAMYYIDQAPPEKSCGREKQVI